MIYCKDGYTESYVVSYVMCRLMEMYTVSEKDCTLFLFFVLGAQCVESGVSCTDWY